MSSPARSDKRTSETLARMDAATLELRRRDFRATTPGERLDEAFELNELANELRAAVLRAQAGT